MGAPLPTLQLGSSLASPLGFFRERQAVLLLDGRAPAGILTFSDVVQYLLKACSRRHRPAPRCRAAGSQRQSAASTSAAWPSGFTDSNTRATLPPRSMKVVRKIPWLPLGLVPQTPN